MKKAVSLLAVWLGVFVCLSAQQPPTAPSQTPTFRTGVDAVQLDVSVLDKDRRPVRGLTAADFTVLDNGKPRTDRGVFRSRTAGAAGAGCHAVHRRRNDRPGRHRQRSAGGTPRRHHDRSVPRARHGPRTPEHCRSAGHQGDARDSGADSGQPRPWRHRSGRPHVLRRATELHGGQGAAETCHRDLGLRHPDSGRGPGRGGLQLRHVPGAGHHQGCAGAT